MKPRNVLYVVIGVLILVLVLINWSAIARPTELNLLVATVNAPLGILIVLIAGAILAIDFLVYSLNQRAWARERRELAAQIEQLRLRADAAEGSRLNVLHETLARETAAIRAQLDRLLAAR